MNYAKLLASNAALTGQVQSTREELKIALLTIDKLKTELAYLRRMKFGSMVGVNYLGRSCCLTEECYQRDVVAFFV